MAPSAKRQPAAAQAKLAFNATDGSLTLKRAPTPPQLDASSAFTDANLHVRQQVIYTLTNLQEALTNVQSGINDLLRAYMQHTSSILAGEDGELNALKIPTKINASANAAMEAASLATKSIAQVTNTPSQVDSAAAAPAEGKSKKRKREKKEKDPNAPKKPLTAAFLYAQSARPIVRVDLENALGPGEALQKNAVNVETTNRWNALPEEEKEVSLLFPQYRSEIMLTAHQRWKQSYRTSMEEWKLEMAKYLAKTGAEIADVHVDEDMSDDGDIEIEAEAGAIDSDASSEDEDEVVKAPSPPAKTPRAANKRQKTAQTPAANGTSLAAPATNAAASTPVPLPPSSRPTVQIPVQTSATETSATAKKDKKKKEKAGSTAPQPIAPAPPAQKEASPEEGSKTGRKSKTSRSTRNAEADAEKENAATPTQEKKKEKRDRSKKKSEGASA